MNNNNDFETEVNTRVEFKLREIKDALQNKLRKHQNLSYLAIENNDVALTTKEMNYKTAYTQLLTIFKEVTDKPLPDKNMTELELNNKKQQVVKSIVDKFDVITNQRIRIDLRTAFMTHISSCIDKLLM